MGLLITAHLADELLLGGDVEAAVQRAALHLVQQDELAAEQRGALALARVARQRGGRALGAGGAGAQRGAEGGREGAGRHHSFMNGDFLQGLGGHAEAGHHALARTRPRHARARRQGQLQRLDPRQGGVRGRGGQRRRGVGEHHGARV